MCFTSSKINKISSILTLVNLYYYNNLDLQKFDSSYKGESLGCLSS